MAQRHLREVVSRLDEVFETLRAEQPPFDDTMRAVIDVIVELHDDRPGLHRMMHRVAPRRTTELAALRAFEDRLTDEIAYHLERCGRGGDDTALTAQTVVHAVDAHLHRVMTGRKVTAEPLLQLAQRLVPPPGL